MDDILKSARLIDSSYEVVNIRKLSGGLNSSVHLCEVKDNKYIIKKYPNEQSNKRLENEFGFVKLMFLAKIKNVPKPIKALPKMNIGIYSFLEGQAIQKATDSNVLKSANFIIDINTRMKFFSNNLKNATDYFLDYEDLLKNIKIRIFNLKTYQNLNNETYSKTLNDIEKYFNSFEENNEIYRKELNSLVVSMKKIISPSDFGLHNMLDDKKNINFLDFEYAGIDNCLKLICDFYCQPRIPISNDHFKLFVYKLNSELIKMDNLYDVVIRFLPIFKIKWACIILNQVNKVNNENYKQKLGDIQIKKANTYLKTF